MSLKVIKTKAGNVVTASKNNPEWGVVTVKSEQKVLETTADGNSTFLRTVSRYALINGKTAELEATYKENMEIPGMRIIHRDTTEEKLGFSARKVSDADDAPFMTVEGQQIYRKSIVVPENSDMQDEIIRHDNQEEIALYNDSVVNESDFS
jgi:hypothetical protein